MTCDPKNVELETLLDMDGLQYWPSPKYWIKIVAHPVEPTKNIPHGVSYSLTLHDRANNRVLGFDNAHNIKKKGRRTKKYTGRRITWDHIHRMERVSFYEFESPLQLIDDFWKAVDEIIV